MLPLPSSGQCHYTAAFSPCGRWLAAGGSDHALDVWDLHAPQQPARRLQSLNGPIMRARFAPDGRLVAVSTEWLATFEAETLSFRWTRAVGTARSVAITPDGNAVILFDGALRWFAVSADDKRQLNWALETVRWPVVDIATEAGRIVVAHAGLLNVLDVESGTSIDDVPLSVSPHRLACSADGILAAVIANGHLSVWNLTTRTAVIERTAAAHGGWLSVAFDPRGRRIVTGGIDSTVAVWDATSDGPPLTTFQWGVGPVYAVTFDRDGLRAAAAGHAGAIVWDIDE